MPRMQIKTLGKLAFVCLTPFAVAACMQTTLTASIDCRNLIGPSLRSDTPPAEPPSDNTIGEVAAFADRQTGQFEIAETKRRSVIEITDGCATEQERLTRKKFLGLF